MRRQITAERDVAIAACGKRLGVLPHCDANCPVDSACRNEWFVVAGEARESRRYGMAQQVASLHCSEHNQWLGLSVTAEYHGGSRSASSQLNGEHAGIPERFQVAHTIEWSHHS
jgi:hypothetical protein